MVGLHGELVECEPIMRVWGKAPNAVQEQSPWSGDEAKRVLVSDVLLRLIFIRRLT